MAAVTVATTGTALLDGTETTDTLVRFASQKMRFVIGSTSGRNYDNAFPVDAGQIIAFPAGVSVTAYAAENTATAFVEEGFSA